MPVTVSAVILTMRTQSNDKREGLHINVLAISLNLRTLSSCWVGVRTSMA